MKNLSKTQFNLINLSILMLPFAFLATRWSGSSEATQNNHNGLYIAILSVVFMFLVGLIPALMAGEKTTKSF